MAVGQPLVAQTPPLERAGTEVLDDDVRPRGEVAEDALAVGAREVERGRPLVAPDHLPPQTDAVLARAVMPGGIGLPRMLDLGHVRAEVAEERPGERAGEQRRDLDDAEALESAAVGAHVSS